MRITVKKLNKKIILCSLLIISIILLISPSYILSQEKPISYQIPFIQSEINIDGVISEGEWDGAEVVYLDNETEPSQNVPAIVDTKVMLAEDGNNFLLAFIADDPEPEKIRAYYSDRDACWDDDMVGVTIDTFNDERRAFQFMSNPLGVQMDSVCDDVAGGGGGFQGGGGPPGGGGFGGNDNSWNAIWDSDGKISDHGYVVEMKIPLDQLRFSGGLEKQTWGIDLQRSYPRDKRHKFSNYIKDYAVFCYLCQLKKAQGFTQLEEKVNLRLVPSVTASYSKNRPDPVTDEWDSDYNLDPSLDVRWGINQDFYLNATVNPDFSQVEADVAKLDVNNTFALFYPERREFFLDGANYFNTNANLVHTRNIISPDYGVKLTGKRDAHSFGLFFTNDDTTSFLIPGNQGSVIAELAGVKSYNTAYRYRLDISRNINLGLILTDRRADDYSNTVVGFDGNIRLGKSDNIEMQVMRSYSEYPTQIQNDFFQKPKLEDYAFKFNYRHDDNNWNWGTQYTEYGDDFRADLGFINKSDYKKIDLSAGHSWTFGPDSKFNRFFVGSDYIKSFDEDGNDLVEEYGIRINVQGPMQSFMFMGFEQRERFYNGKYFDEYNFFIFGHIRPIAVLEIGADFNFGDSVDYYNTRLGELLSIRPEIDLQLGKHFEIVLRHTYEKMDIEGKRLYSINLSDLRLTYQFTIRSFLRVIVQYSDTKYDPSLFIFPIDSRYKDMASQILYSYKINPQTRFYIGYSDTGFQNDQTSRIMMTNRSVFSKFSYAW